MWKPSNCRWESNLKSYVDVGAAEVPRKHFKVGSESYFRSLGWVKHATQQHGGQNQHS